MALADVAQRHENVEIACGRFIRNRSETPNRLELHNRRRPCRRRMAILCAFRGRNTLSYQRIADAGAIPRDFSTPLANESSRVGIKLEFESR